MAKIAPSIANSSICEACQSKIGAQATIACTAQHLCTVAVSIDPVMSVAVKALVKDAFGGDKSMMRQ